MSTVTTHSRARTPERAGQSGFARFVRAAVSSVAATSISQATLLAILWWGGNPSLASTVAFAAGAVPNYLLTRRWVWGRQGKPAVRRELAPYLAVIALGGLTAVGLTTVTGWLLAPLDLSHALRVFLLDSAYVTSYALVFVLKFTLLDRLVFGRDALRIPATTSPS